MDKSSASDESGQRKKVANYSQLIQLSGLPDIEDITDYSVHGSGLYDDDREPLAFSCRINYMIISRDGIEVHTNMLLFDPENLLPNTILHFSVEKDSRDNRWTGTFGPGKNFTLDELTFFKRLAETPPYPAEPASGESTPENDQRREIPDKLASESEFFTQLEATGSNAAAAPEEDPLGEIE